MENIGLWGLVITAVLTSLCSIVVQSSNDAELGKAIKAAMARRKGPVRRAGVTMTILGFGSAVMWTLVAFGTGDWRWAAVFWVPFAAGWIGRAALAGKEPDDEWISKRKPDNDIDYEFRAEGREVRAVVAYNGKVLRSGPWCETSSNATFELARRLGREIRDAA